MTIDPTTAATTSTSGARAPASSGLGQDAFMTLLVTQLAHQDPTKPMDDTQFIAQLAQFSSLEKLTAMDVSLARIIQLLSPTAPPPVGTAQNPVTTPKGTN